MKKKLLLPLMIFLIALLFSVVQYIEKEAEFAQWKSASGLVQTIDFSHRKKAGKSSHTITYSYEVENITYEGSNTYSGRSSDYISGDVTEIWYDPDEPSHSSFHRPNSLSYSLTPLFMGGAAALLIYRKK